MLEQAIPFDTSKGGTVPNLCLDNVRRGYGIENKYSSAWEAWLHTEQHPDSNVPVGLAVPLYYSYTATIDGVTANYGHINVRLPNGTVWSDGNIYRSISDYTSKMFPKFVGWGESVNDFKVIQGGEDMTVDDALARRLLSLSTLMAQPGTDPDRQPTTKEVEDLIGKDAVQACDELMSYSPWGANWNKVKHYDEDVASAAKPGTPTKQSVLTYVNKNLS